MDYFELTVLNSWKSHPKNINPRYSYNYLKSAINDIANMFDAIYWKPLLLACEYEIDFDRNESPACIGWNSASKKFRVTLGNDNAWSSIYPVHGDTVLIHEFMHLIFGHLNEADWKDLTEKKILNIAQDITINGFLHIPDDKGCTAKSVGDQLHIVLPLGLSSRQYYELILPHIPKNPPMQAGINPQMDKSGDPIDDEAMDALDRIMGRIAPHLSDDDNSEIIQNVNSELGIFDVEAIKSRYPKWKSDLRLEVSGAIAISKTIHTYKRPSRRTGQFPSTKKLKVKKLIAALDVSGSIDNSVMPKLIGVLRDLYQYVKGDTELWKFNHCLKSTEKFNLKCQYKETGSGGTNFHSVIDKVAKMRPENRPGAVIFITDGEGEPMDNVVIPGVRIIWLVYGSNGWLSSGIGTTCGRLIEVGK